MDKDFFDEIERIGEDREDKDYWDYAKVLLDNARNIRDRWRNWIEEELKHLRFYADFLSSSTIGETKDKLLQIAKRIEELDKRILREVILRIDSFTKKSKIVSSRSLLLYMLITKLLYVLSKI